MERLWSRTTCYWVQSLWFVVFMWVWVCPVMQHTILVVWGGNVLLWLWVSFLLVLVLKMQFYYCSLHLLHHADCSVPCRGNAAGSHITLAPPPGKNLQLQQETAVMWRQHIRLMSLENKYLMGLQSKLWKINIKYILNSCAALTLYFECHMIAPWCTTWWKYFPLLELPDSYNYIYFILMYLSYI